MKVKEFIKNILIDEIKDIQQKCGHHFLSFGLISQGIEFYGACLDEGSFFEIGKSGSGFRMAIIELFPSNYHPFAEEKNKPFDLYENLRCGLIHAVLPKAELELIQQSEIHRFGNHLEIKSIRKRDRLILVSQILMADFEKAGLEIIRRIEDREISDDKVYKEFMGIDP